MNEQMNPFQAFFTSKDLHDCIKQLNSTISKPEKQVEPETSNLKFQCFVKNEKYDCLAGVNLRKQILYAFANNFNNDCQIKILVFQKSNGCRSQLSLKNINGVVTSMNFILYQDTGNEKTVYKLLIGFKDGFLKVIDLSDASIKARRIDAKPIVSIINGDYMKFHQQNVSILLAEDSYIYFLDLKSLQIIYVLKPNLVTCDKALSIQIDCQCSYLMQTTHGGYIVFWKMAQIIKHFKQISMIQDKKGRLKEYNVLPIRVNHSIAINGLIGCYFYGHTLVVINKTGLLRIIVINVRMQQEFVVLSEYQIKNPQYISCARVYAQQDCILISKSRGTQHPYVQKLIINEQFNICKRIIIDFPKLDTIHQFYLPADQSILMCRGQNSYGIGYHHELFQNGEYSKHNNGTKMDIEDY